MMDVFDRQSFQLPVDDSYSYFQQRTIPTDRVGSYLGMARNLCNKIIRLDAMGNKVYFHNEFGLHVRDLLELDYATFIEYINEAEELTEEPRPLPPKPPTE
jgi:hypothetical protein